MLRLYVENIETIKSRETHKALRIKKGFWPMSFFALSFPLEPR
jgi:hypothetical protein